MKKKIIWIICIALVVGGLVAGGAAYVSDYYRADSEAIDAFCADISANEIEIEGGVAFESGREGIGLIIYPGGKVEYTAYEPLAQRLAEWGVLCVVVEMPLNLAVLNVDAADAIREQFPDIDTWFIGGHSLGGSMAASHAAGNADKYAGLILLGAYSTADLSDGGVGVLSLYGEHDLVMNREKYDQYKSNLPQNLVENEIEGGCHAYFGMYGEQEGDGVADITPEMQIDLTANAIYEFILRETQE